jgi:hypothetical protein
MISPELSRRLGHALGTHRVTFDERAKVIAAAESGAASFADLPADVRALVEDIEKRPPVSLDDLEPVPGPYDPPG